MAWNGLTLTVDGRNALNEAQAANVISFKAIVIGDGAPPSNYRTQTSLVHQLFEITDLNVSVTTDGCVIIGDFPNPGYDYYFREVGVIVSTGSGDKLYVYDNCGDDAQSIVWSTGVESTEKRIKLSLLISDVDSITVINPGVLYVPYSEFEVLAQEVEESVQNKIDGNGGDVASTIVSEIAVIGDSESTIPESNDSTKTLWGKIRKFIVDFNNWKTGVCLLGQLVNNCVTNRPDLPLAAAQGKALMDLYTQLNSDFTNFAFQDAFKPTNIKKGVLINMPNGTTRIGTFEGYVATETDLYLRGNNIKGWRNVGGNNICTFQSDKVVFNNPNQRRIMVMPSVFIRQPGYTKLKMECKLNMPTSDTYFKIVRCHFLDNDNYYTDLVEADGGRVGSGQKIVSWNISSLNSVTYLGFRSGEMSGEIYRIWLE